MKPPDTANWVTTISPGQRVRLLRLAYRLCWNIEDAEDALQTALLAATHKAGQLRDMDKRWSWLRSIVVQQCHLLQRSRTRRSWQDLGGNEPATQPVNHRPSTEAELGELMKRLIQDLPDQQRIALTLRHLEQLAYGDIARIMEVTEATVRTHVKAGRDALRRMILQRHPEWRP